MLTRRSAIRLGALGGAGLLLSGGRAAAGTAPAVTPPAPFTVPLSVPPVLRPVRRTLTSDVYALTMKEADVEILPGVTTRVRGYGGLFPGPTIRARADRTTVVTHTNGLTVPASVHLHGGHTPSADDGQPMDMVMPGGRRTYTYPNQQVASTLWYHDHAHHTEAESVFLGLAGTYLLSDAWEDCLRLPSGDQDVVLMLRDVKLDEQGGIAFSMLDGSAERDILLVNGRPQPYMKVSGRKYRLRLLNSSNGRHYLLGLDNGDALTQIASDGGLLPAPVPATTVALSPGERVDVVVDFARYAEGTRLVLTNTDPEAVDRTRDVLRFDVGAPEPDDSLLPDRLRPLPALGAATVTRDVVLDFDPVSGDPTIDGKVYDPDRVDTQVAFGADEIWRVYNKDVTFRHNFHVHGVHFRVLDRDGTPVSGHEAGWKDTVAIPNGSTVRLQARFDRHTGRYLYHCHMLEHSSMGMMAQYEVLS
ncbi:multicopper oxidase family protein [Streptomyces sp. NPDC050560]|uniref:multicopper oxidase family protein n=1 Tax=Streptomyces sp. NPDC050560 TaxID=3365630 RepID=UPI0037B7E335